MTTLTTHDIDRAATALIRAVTGLDLDALDETLALAPARATLTSRAPAQNNELAAIEAQIAALEARKAELRGAA